MNNRRKRKLVRPDLQVGSILFGLGLAMVTVVVQSLTMTFVLHRLAAQAPTDGPAILRGTPQMLALSALAACLILAPIVLAMTLDATHRFAGPIHRIAQHLEEVVQGGQPEPLKLRDGDRFQDLAQLVNQALEVTARGTEEGEQKRGQLHDISSARRVS